MVISRCHAIQKNNLNCQLRVPVARDAQLHNEAQSLEVVTSFAYHAPFPSSVRWMVQRRAGWFLYLFPHPFFPNGSVLWSITTLSILLATWTTKSMQRL